MEREDIEKAAKEYVYKARASFVGITPEEYEEQRNPEYPYNVGTDENFESLFISGADWRINSVWHDASEQPEKKPALVAYPHIDGSYGYLVVPNPQEVKEAIDRWAYIEDLLPNTED